MQIIRYQIGAREPRLGWLLGDMVGPLEGTPYGEYRRLDADVPLQDVNLLAPVQPGKIIGVGYNYAQHGNRAAVDIPETPILFMKPTSSVIGSGQNIVIPPQSRQVEHEAEMAVVIGRRGRWIRAESAMDYVFGYTVANDVTARDLLERDGQWARSKGFDTFCPLGPWIETELDTSDLLVTCHVNDEMRQMDSTHEMFFTIPQLITFVSSVMTIFPGDVISLPISSL